MSGLRGIALTVVLSMLAAALGVWAGSYTVRAHASPLSLHTMLHRSLDLTAQQQQQIENLERDYAARRALREAQMRQANADLAGAYRQGHAYTADVQAAIDRFHMASDALQKETMLHVIAMRQVLTPAQAARFDDTVVKSLTAPAP
jgi:Spy/CpxP family protein refolding chaperone